jgi:hypothetical protein
MVALVRIERTSLRLQLSAKTTSATVRILVGRCGYDPLPFRRVLQTRCRNHLLYLPFVLVASRGYDPLSLPYQGSALPLS